MSIPEFEDDKTLEFIVFSVRPETIYYENVDLSLINTLCSEGHSKVIIFHFNTTFLL